MCTKLGLRHFLVDHETPILVLIARSGLKYVILSYFILLVGPYLWLREKLGFWLQLQGWYNRLQRDEVVAEWKKIKEKMSLHVHCHISGGHFLLDLCARLRFYIFSKELPVVLKAFVHGDESLFDNHPDLQEALVWVYFHSNIPEFNKMECWGPLKEASSPSTGAYNIYDDHNPHPCQEACNCCFPPMSLIPWAQNFSGESEIGGISLNGIQQKQQNFVSGDGS